MSKPLADAAGTFNVVDGSLYFATDKGLQRWTPTEGLTLVHDIPPSDEPPRGRRLPTVVPAAAGSSGQAHATTTARPSSTRPGPEGAHRVGGSELYIYNLIATGDGRVIFAGADAQDENRPGLWVSDGTSTSPDHPDRAVRREPVRRRQARCDRHPPSLGGGDELHRFDAALEHFDLLVDINRWTVGSDPVDAARVGNRVVFKTTEQRTLWTTDGTYAGTVPLLERDSTGQPIDPFGLASDDTLALFAARRHLPHRRHARRHGPDHRHRNRAGRVQPAGPRRHDVLFTARKRDEAGWEHDLWRTDGTAAGTQRVTTGAPQLVGRRARQRGDAARVRLLRRRLGDGRHHRRVASALPGPGRHARALRRLRSTTGSWSPVVIRTAVRSCGTSTSRATRRGW